MRADRPLLLLLAALTAGCADPEPFVDLDTRAYLTPTISKPIDPVLKSNSAYLRICYSDSTPWDEVVALATERCGAHGLQVYPNIVVQRWQCRAASPHLALTRCYDPEMMIGDQPVNPFDEAAVRRWETLTGKKAKPHNELTLPGAADTRSATPAAPSPTQPASPAPPAPAVLGTVPPAPATPPLSPADIAGRPPMPPPLPPRQTMQPPPAAPEAYPSGNFSLPQGSWGDHFEQ